VLAAVADPAKARDVADVLVNFSEPIVRALAAPGTPERPRRSRPSTRRCSASKPTRRCRAPTGCRR
jgi:hypothetical protein